jgi:hypothetical protein
MVRSASKVAPGRRCPGSIALPALIKGGWLEGGEKAFPDSIPNTCSTQELISREDFDPVSSRTLHIAYYPRGAWVVQIYARLSKSESPILRERFAQLKETPLSERGLAVATKFRILSCAARRLNEEINRLQMLIEQDMKTVLDCLEAKSAFNVPDEDAPYQLLQAIDAVYYEARSTYEIVGSFLTEFFSRVLDRAIGEKALRAALQARGMDLQWIDDLRSDRILLFHETAPWFAYRVQDNPPRFEPVVLKRNVETLDNPEDYISLLRLQEIGKGFEQALKVLHTYVLEEIREFEEKHPT